MKLLKRTLSGLTLLCLTASLIGCATAPADLDVLPELPPAGLARTCPKPELPPIRTNADLLTAIRLWERALEDCNVDKRALQAWIDDVKDAYGLN